MIQVDTRTLLYAILNFGTLCDLTNVSFTMVTVDGASQN